MNKLRTDGQRTGRGERKVRKGRELRAVAGVPRLHESGLFRDSNPWDVGSARYLQQLWIPALATQYKRGL